MVNAAIILGEIKNKIVELSDKVDDKAIEDIAQKLAKCSGKILTIGTGKSGIIANEISSLLSTSGTVSFTINPLSALHGEIGTIENGDALIIFSKSGETSEIVRLLSYLKKKNLYIVSITTNQNSSISKMSDETILIENIKECCPYDVLPTTSIIEQLILGIVLVTMIMQYKEIPLETLLFNHPEGSLFDKINDKLGI